jgi:hypothetical protein
MPAFVRAVGLLMSAIWVCAWHDKVLNEDELFTLESRASKVSDSGGAWVSRRLLTYIRLFRMQSVFGDADAPIVVELAQKPGSTTRSGRSGA